MSREQRRLVQAAANRIKSIKAPRKAVWKGELLRVEMLKTKWKGDRV